MMKKFLFVFVSIALLAAPTIVAAQDEKPAEPASEESKDEKPTDAPAEEKPAEEAGEKPDPEKAPEGEEKPQEEPNGEQPVEEEATEEVEEEVEEEQVEEPDTFESDTESESEEGGFGDSPIAGLANDGGDFEPLEDIEEETLAQIIPAEVYPRIEWGGGFRFRLLGFVNYDLDTGGTSAILPPLQTFTNSAADDRQDTSIPDEDADGLWGANLRLRLDPSIHISEMLEIHTEIDFLDNIVLGTIPGARDGDDGITPELQNNIANSTQRSPQGRYWYEDAVKVNEVYGTVRSIFGELRAGRMDDHWGMGMWMNDGDCKDCDYGNNADRLFLRSGIFGLYGSFAIDFPDEGPTSKSPSRLGGQPYDLTQVDEADQFTFTIMRSPVTREDLELQQRALVEDKAIVPNGGILYRYRTQDGYFDQSDLLNAPIDPAAPPLLIYQGQSLHVFDLWGQLLYNPSHDTYVRIEAEGLLGFGSVDNDSGQPVGDETNTEDAINCFDENLRLANPDRCLNKQDIFQWGVALESEIRLGGPIIFGLNGGAASGGSTANYGLGAERPDYDFFRFNADYHVDLILFRNIIGTVTNAAYYNPYISAKFLEQSDSHLRLDLDGIFSHALDIEGTPSGESALYGLEFDAAVRYIVLEQFEAAIEGGLLFPFGALDAAEDRPRYTTPGDTGPFGADEEAGIAWTLQFKFFWQF